MEQSHWMWCQPNMICCNYGSGWRKLWIILGVALDRAYQMKDPERGVFLIHGWWDCPGPTLLTPEQEGLVTKDCCCPWSNQDWKVRCVSTSCCSLDLYEAFSEGQHEIRSYDTCTPSKDLGMGIMPSSSTEPKNGFCRQNCRLQIARETLEDESTKVPYCTKAVVSLMMPDYGHLSPSYSEQ